MATLLDPVTIEILWSRVTSIVDEAAKVIIRTSFSTLSNKANGQRRLSSDNERPAEARERDRVMGYVTDAAGP